MASQEVCLFWAEGDIITPMANTLVAVVRAIAKQGGLDATLADIEACEPIAPLPMAERTAAAAMEINL